MARREWDRGWRAACGAAIFAVAASAAGAAELDGVTLPDTLAADGTELHLNGIALRTYSWVGINIYVAGLYLEHPSHDAEAILDAPEKKVLVVRFVRDVDVAHAREAWSHGFAMNCRLPCHLPPDEVARFLAAVPAMHAGDRSTLVFASGRVQISMNGRSLGTVGDPVFARAILASFIGPYPPTARLKRELLGTPG